MSRRGYAEMKDSGVAWLGEVPAHWGVLNCKFGYSIQLGKMLQNEQQSPEDVQVPYLKAAHVQWEKVAIADLPEMWASPHDFKKFSVKSGDLLVCEGGEAGRAGMLAEAPNNCIIQNALHRVRAKRNNSNKYLMYLLEIAGHSEWLGILCNKATIAHFTGEKFDCLAITLPPAKEQVAIADFLDRETTQIDALVEKKKQQIALLKEKRIALISHAVTKGLDPNAAMKDSGVEWLGEVPVYWTIGRLKQAIGECKNGVWGEDARGDGNDIVCVRVADFDRQTFRVNVNSPTMRSVDADEENGRLLESGNLLLEKSGGGDKRPVGCVVQYTHDIKAVSSNFISRIAIKGGQSADFLTYLHAHLYSSCVNVRSIKQTTGIQNLDASSYFNEAIALPPEHEQTAIAAFIDRETAQIDALVEKIEQSIDLLREYRVALISDAVTGKIDVRKE